MPVDPILLHVGYICTSNTHSACTELYVRFNLFEQCCTILLFAAIQPCRAVGKVSQRIVHSSMSWCQLSLIFCTLQLATLSLACHYKRINHIPWLLKLRQISRWPQESRLAESDIILSTCTIIRNSCTHFGGCSYNYDYTNVQYFLATDN